MDQVILTPDGYSKMVDDLNYLKTKKRREVANQLEFARSLGDLRENAEYETAKEAKHQLEIRIGELEAKLSRAKIVDPTEIRRDKVFLGSTAEIKNMETGDVFKYTLVAQDEANFAEGKIAVTSPIGKGLLGKGPNEIAEIMIPAGKVKYLIINIS